MQPRNARVLGWPLAIEPYFRRLPGSRALLQAIAEEPWDDTLRLILADWLEDHGESARASFVRLQVRRQRLPEWDRVSRSQLQQQEGKLFAEHAGSWLAGLPDLEGVNWEVPENFTGGLLENLRVEVAVLRRHGRALFGAVALRGLRVLGLGDAWWNEGTWFPWVARLTRLELPDNRLGVDGVQRLVASPHLAQLTSLDLSGNLIRDQGARALAESAHLATLVSLDLGDNWIGAEGARALAESPHLVHLCSLDLSDNWIGAEGVRALASGRGLRNLESLELWDNGIGTAGARALAGSPHLRSLTSLGVGFNGIGTEGARALGESPHLTNLDRLRLHFNGIEDEGARVLAASAHLAGVATLDLDYNEIGEEVRDLISQRFGTRIQAGAGSVGK